MKVLDFVKLGGPGYTTTPENFRQFLHHVDTKLILLDDGTNIYPGHGDKGILGETKRLHAGFKSRSHSCDNHGHISWED